MAGNRRLHDETLPVRLRVLFGKVGLVPRLMTALDRGQTSVEDICSGRNVPPEVLMIVECLEMAPVWAWPERWRSCRGRDASIHVRRVRQTTSHDDQNARGPVMTTYRYTDTELRRAAAIIDSGGTPSDAANALGVSKKAILHLQDRGKLPRRRAPSAHNVAQSLAARKRYAEMQAMIDRDGLTQSQLARAVGVSPSRISALVARKKIYFRVDGG